MEKNIRRTSKGAITAIIIGFVLFCIAVGVGIVLLIIKFVPKDYEGTWQCSENSIVEINDNEFTIYKNDSVYRNGPYSVKKIVVNDSSRGFELESASIKYDISIVKNILTMIDRSDYSVYVCTKKN